VQQQYQWTICRFVTGFQDMHGAGVVVVDEAERVPPGSGRSERVVIAVGYPFVVLRLKVDIPRPARGLYPEGIRR